MEKVKFFVRNFKRFRSGELEHQEISSVIVKEIMFSVNMWRAPWRDQPLWRLWFAPIVYFISFMFSLSGYPRILDIPEWGKFIDILAGIEMSCAKLVFLCFQRHKMLRLIDDMDQMSKELRKRANKEPKIKKMMDSDYVMEVIVLIFTNVFGILFLLFSSIQVLLMSPKQLVVPMALSFTSDIVKGPGSTFWLMFAIETFLTNYVALAVTLSDVMIGNLYNQLILHVKVLHYDMMLLSEDEGATEQKMLDKFREYSIRYHSLWELNQRFQRVMKPFFVNSVGATIFATTFSCVELGIMVNVDLAECVKPFMYFFFISFPLFYWCWLGNRLSEQSSDLALSAFIYKTNASTIRTQRLQLNFIQMVMDPITINANPFFVLNFDIFVRVMKVAYQFTAVFKNFYKRQVM